MPEPRLPFDLDNPPQKPPRGVDRLAYMIAYELRLDHLPDSTDGMCRARRCVRETSYPCMPRRIADAGLLGSIGAWAGIDPPIAMPPRGIVDGPLPPRIDRGFPAVNGRASS